MSEPAQRRHPLAAHGSLRREQIERIRRRHRGYRLLLATSTLVVLLQPLAQRWPLLNSLAAIVLALVMMLFLTRFSPLRAHRKSFYGLGIAAIASELLWMFGLAHWPALTIHLASLHLVIWTLFIGAFLLRKSLALMLEPYVTKAVVMGAAAGYLLIGYLGAFLLHTLLLWHPDAFDLSQLPPGVDPVHSPQRAFPAMEVASFGALTTSGSAIAQPGEVLASTGCLVITILGQLYVAVLIALILGRFHRRSGI